MFIASAYPNSAISAWAMLAIALVAVGSLGCWLAFVFLAAGKSDHGDISHLPVVASPDAAAQDEQSGSGLAPPDRRHGVAA